MLRSILRTLIVVFFLMAGFLGLWLVPVESLWYEPGDIVISDGDAKNPPAFNSNRIIKRDFLGHYSGVIRETDSLDSVCDGTSGNFVYRKEASDKTPEIKKPLLEWIGGTCPGKTLPVGRYQADICWFVQSPFYFMPEKSVCERRGFNMMEELPK